MKKWDKINLTVLNTGCILALLIVLFPLLLISQYNYPSADDWSFSLYSYRAVQNGEGFLGAIKGALEAVRYYYVNWEGRFSIPFLGAFQPGIWGEKCYGAVAWLMTGSIIFSELFLCKSLLKLSGGKQCLTLSIPIMVPALILQLLYTPSPEESFYWYNGAVNYTFVYALSLVLVALFLRLGIADYSGWKYSLLAAVSCVLAVIIGGGNFATSLSCLLTLIILSGFFFLLNKRAFRRTWFLTAIVGICLLICILAPGNRVRINGNFGGETEGAINAVIMSLIRSFTNIYSWTNLKTVLMLLFILPFIRGAVKQLNYDFRFPGLFSLITFGLYASQATATMYVDGTTGGGRMAAILFYSYYVWMVGNVSYWMGWLGRRKNRAEAFSKSKASCPEKYIIPYCAAIGIILIGIIYMTDLRQLTSYKAYRNWRQGWAQQYAAEWEERLKILHNDSITEVEFQPLSVYPEMLLYTDLQDESGYIWVNLACATYYEKEVIRVRSPEEPE